MTDSCRWHRTPKPSPDVIRVLEQALEAAKRGQIRCLVVVVVNPIHEVEHATGGEHHAGYGHVLIGGLSAAVQTILREIDLE